MYKRILLPLNGSLVAEGALSHAIVLAKHFRAELILLRVIPPLPGKLHLYPEAHRKIEEMNREAAVEYLDRVARNIQESGIPTRVGIIDGHPHKEIVHFAESEQVNVIVMCIRGHSGISRLLVGSIADRVGRKVNLPLLLIRAQKDIQDGE